MDIEKPSVPPVFDVETGASVTAFHDAKLEEFGYEPEMKRSFGTLEMIGFSFGIVNSWAALISVLIVGIVSGGPPVIVWGWIGVCFFTLFVAYAFAEMCSAYPIAGGQYSWVAILSPPRYARPLAYITGWFMNGGLVSLNAGNWLLFSNYILGIAKLNNPSYNIERWHNVVMSYFVAVSITLVNIYLSKYLRYLAKWNLLWNVIVFLVTMITMLAGQKKKQSARFVFIEFQNETGFEAPGMAVMIGLLQCLFSITCFDTPSKMVEDMKNPTKDGPRAILASVYLGAITGWIYLVVCYFCVGDLQTTANTPTGVPIIQIYYDATRSTAGASILTFFLATGFLLGGTCLVADTSRGLWAFARDHGLPASSILARVGKQNVPTNALIMSCIVQMAINSIYFGGYEGFSTIISLGIFGFYFSYIMALLARLLAYFSAHVEVIPGPYSLGRWSPIVHLVGLVYLLWGVVDLCFPQTGPVTGSNMNYCSAAFGAFALISLFTWLWTGREHFTGPKIDAVLASARPALEARLEQSTIVPTSTSSATPESDEKKLSRLVLSSQMASRIKARKKPWRSKEVARLFTGRN